MKKVLLFLAEGFEEIEALTVVDVLRRAEIICDTCSIKDEYVKGCHDIVVKADKNIMDDDLKTYDAVVLPGGDARCRKFKVQYKSNRNSKGILC